MTDYQDALVLENLELVNWVIRTRISIPNRPLLTYDDFYAIGCEAICRAALKYQPDMGAFAPFACRYIYNAIVDHCRAMNYRLERSVEISEDENASLLDIGDLWYRHVCDITLSKMSAGVLPYGAVSSSGFGDGGYTCYTHADENGVIDFAFIVFI